MLKNNLIHEHGKQPTELESSQKKKIPLENNATLPENQVFGDLLGKNILLTTRSDQLNILGQTFRPIFTGRIVRVTDGFITLYPVTIKMSNAPFFQFPTPLNFAIEMIAFFLPFDPETRFPIP
ncbi:hypothetical protein QUF99_14120 [Bacillus sp. DX4.1]|uniref:hypothetical protein n=1 Tax=Bacillus sp. DX4.1 TaxID=3055867 RepID=UPI0025A13F16|nr:hypothetical protein [Bacillus sp. DX4.1]MDM5188410.1 hypothetical protein [Bacillus sp. DX4.1]